MSRKATGVKNRTMHQIIPATENTSNRTTRVSAGTSEFTSRLR
jgi:hypothetical protein